MIKKITAKYTLKDSSALRDLAYWLSKEPSERVMAVEELRRNYYGTSGRLQRVVRVAQGSPRRNKDLADLEALSEK